MLRLRRVFEVQWHADLALAAALVGIEVAAVLPTVIAANPTSTTMIMVMLALRLIADAALAWRRRAPLATLAVVVAVAVPASGIPPWAAEALLGTAVPGEMGISWAAPFAVYSAVVYAHRPRTTWLLTAALMVLAAEPWRPEIRAMTAIPPLLLVPAVLGMYVASKRKLVAALTERADRAEREQRLLAEQARTAERVRLAGEMHDVVSHRVSMMVLQAGALRMTAADEQTKDGVEELRVAGCQALDELRDLIGVLCSPSDSADREAGEPLAVTSIDLTALIDESRSAGMTVTMDITGNAVQVSPIVARGAYRVVQESLTNARKHAAGAVVSVAVSYEADRLWLRISNGAAMRPVDSELVASGSGHGLAGLRQRVELLGGYLHAGSEPGGGFTVAANLPNLVPRRESDLHGR